ncbi:MAG: hypothetical protein ACO4BJ_06845, partial [Planctomycetota bacterium]
METMPLGGETAPQAGAQDRIRAIYRLACPHSEARELAEAIAIELTVEVPRALIDRYPRISRDVVARIESLSEEGGWSRLVLSFDPSLAGGGLPQLINLLSGNVSMLPGVELLGAELPPSRLAEHPGPRHGISG